MSSIGNIFGDKGVRQMNELHKMYQPIYLKAPARAGCDAEIRSEVKHKEQVLRYLRYGEKGGDLRIETLRPGETESLKPKKMRSRNQARNLIIRHPYRINDTMILKIIIVLERS